MHCTCTKEGSKEATWFSQACSHSPQQHSHLTLLASHTPLGAPSYISQQLCLHNALRMQYRGFIMGMHFRITVSGNNYVWVVKNIEVLVKKRFCTWKYSPKMFPLFLRPKTGSGRTRRHSLTLQTHPLSTACKKVAAKLTTNRQDLQWPEQILLCLKLGRLHSSNGKDLLLAQEGRCKGSLCEKRPARQSKA